MKEMMVIQQILMGATCNLYSQVVPLEHGTQLLLLPLRHH